MATVEKVTLTLPQDLMDTVRELAPPRGRSKYVAKALRHFIAEEEKRILREELIAGYQATAEESTTIAAEWMSLGQESWERNVPAYEVGEEDDDATSPPA